MKRIIFSIVCILLVGFSFYLYWGRESGEQKAIRMVKESHALSEQYTTEQYFIKFLSKEPDIKTIQGWKVYNDEKSNKYIVTNSIEYYDKGKYICVFEVYPKMNLVRKLSEDEYRKEIRSFPEMYEPK